MITPTRWLVAVALLGLLTGGAAGSQEPHALPRLSGPFPVSRHTLVLTDSTRGEPATADSTDRRTLTLNVWYPARDTIGTPAPYMPNLAAYRDAMPPATLAAWEAATTKVTLDAPAAAGPFPVLLFSHGWSGRSASYSIWLSEVASHGFIVIGIDHPYLGAVAMPDGSTTVPTEAQFSAVPMSADLFYSQDIGFVRGALRQLNASDPLLTGTIRTDAVFASGHSSGFGSAASAYAELHAGLKGLISFDSGVSGLARDRGVGVPLLLVRAEDPSYTSLYVRGPNTNPHGTIYDSAFVRSMVAPFYDLQILRTGHNAVLDNITTSAGQAREDVEAVHALIGRYTMRFLQGVLQEKPLLRVRPEDAGRVRLQRVRLDPR